MNSSTNSATSSAASTDTTSSPRLATHSSLAATEGRSPLAKGEQISGQVTSSQALAQGGYKVEVELSNGQQLSLITNKPFASGQEIQLTGKNDLQVEIKPLNLPQLLHSLAKQLAYLPSIKVSVANPSLPSIPTNTASLASVSSSQALSNNQGHLITLQLANNKSLQLISSQPLSPGAQVYLANSSQGQLSVRELPEASLNLARLLTANLPVITETTNNLSSTQTTARPTLSLASLLATASEQLRYALPRQAPMQTSLNQLANLLPQLIKQTSGLAPAATTNTSTTNLVATSLNNPPTSNISLSTEAGTAKTTISNQQISSLLSQLGLSSSTANSTSTRLVGLVQQLLTSFVQSPSQLTATGIQNFLSSSGMFFEANLLNSANPVTGDIKLQLGQLAALLRQEMAANPNAARQEVLQQLNQQVQSMTSRLEVQQLSSLQATQATAERGQPAQLVQMDLPYAIRGEWFEAKLEIRRWLEEKETEEAMEEYLRRTKIWEVRLNFTLKDYGKLHTHLRLQDENLNADIWIEEQAAFSPIKHQAEILAARLRRLGAEIPEVTCHLGSPPTPAPPAANKAQIINTKI